MNHALALREDGKQYLDERVGCIVPLLPDMQDSSSVLKMFSSHNWVLDRSEAYGKDGILAQMHCSVCGLGRMMILYDIKESADRVRQNLQKLET